MQTDLEIAQSAPPRPITEIAAELGIAPEHLEPYGWYKAKISLQAFRPEAKRGKLILVTAITPTPAGEGKTTCSIGLADSLNLLGCKTALALREPSLGPVFGLKGGATGGGYAQVIPMEDVNLHFNGDFHALTAANNLIAACIDNHLHFGNALKIRTVTFRRCMDVNDRMLRDVTLRFKDEVRHDSFQITVASELMAVFCLAEDLEDLRKRIGRIVIGTNEDGAPVTVDDLGVTGAALVLLKDAVKPNLVQTLYGTPALIHGGPFANIAHGCNSVIATKLALNYADYVVTEAGFAADLGAEKFVDIKCRSAHLAPDAIVVVATLRALKMHGGVAKTDLARSNPAAVAAGFANFKTHVEHMQNNFGYKVPVLAAVNRFASDTAEEMETFRKLCAENGFAFDCITSHPDGHEGAIALAKHVAQAIADADAERKAHPEKYPADFTAYSLEAGLEANVRTICNKFYNVTRIEYSDSARRDLAELIRLGCDHLPVCIAKTPYALNDGSADPQTIHVQELRLSAGAGFVVVLTGQIMTMPGLPREPLAAKIDLKDGKVVGMM